MATVAETASTSLLLAFPDSAVWLDAMVAVLVDTVVVREVRSDWLAFPAIAVALDVMFPVFVDTLVLVVSSAL